MRTNQARLGFWPVLALTLALLGWLAPRAEAVPQMQIKFEGYTSRTETLTNFPVLVVLSNNVGNSGFTFANFVTTNGTDLRFGTNTTDTSLNYEIESWNTNAGQVSYVWVQVPTIPADGSGTIWAKWGDPANSNQLACTTNGATWTNGFAGVWHLRESGNGTSGEYKDSTSFGRNARGGGGNSSLCPVQTNGVIGKGESFDGTDDYIDTSYVLPTTNFSYSFWAKSASSGAANRPFGNADGTLGLSGSSILWGYNVAANLYAIFRTNANNAATDIQVTPPGIASGWHHVAVSLADTGTTLCWDGNRLTKNAAITKITSSYTTRFGRDGSGTDHFNGQMDEVRISSIACSTNWVWAEYMTMASNTTFSKYAMEGVGIGPTIQNTDTADVTPTSATFNGLLTSTGTSATAVCVYWGTDPNAWAKTNWFNGGAVNPAWTNNTPFSTNIASGISPNLNYYYTYGASNTTTNVVATGIKSFITGELTVQATDPNGRADAWDTAAFTVYRPASCTNEELIVNYTLGGTATNGADYTIAPASGTVVIARGSTNGLITVTPVARAAAQQTVILTLTSGSYVIGSANAATCTLAAVTAAGNRYWTSMVDGTYAVGANWLNDLAPWPFDNAFFTNSASYAVNWNANAAVAGATFSAASGTVTLNLGAYTWATPVTVGNAAGYSAVVQNGGTLQATNGLAVGYGGSKRGSMTVSNGGRLYTRGQNIGRDGGGSGCSLVVAGTGSVMTVLAVTGGSGQYYDYASQVVVTNGGALIDAGNGNQYVGNSATSTNNSWLITGAGSVYSNTSGAMFYLGNSGAGNRLTVSDGGSFYYSGYFYPSTSNNQVLVTGSNSVLTLGYATVLGNGPGGYNTLTITNGGRANLQTYNTLGSVTNAPGNTIVVTGPGSSLRTGDNLSLGGASIGNRVTVRDGAQYNVNGGLAVGGFSAASFIVPPSPWNNTVEVSGTGSLVVCANGCQICVGSNSSVTVQGTPCNGNGGNLMLWNGGGVELQGSGVLGSGYGGTGIISNYLGGIFQFTSLSAATINNGTPGSIVINGGTVSFRAVTTASVFCNQSGQPLDSTNKMSWFGDNTFRLNTATNVAGQNYTFQTGTGTNFAGLSLINGSKYQGNVTIGTGGTLSFAGGAQTISGTLTMQSAGTLAATIGSSNDYLSVTGTVNLASAQLQVALGTDPTPLYPIHFLRTAGLGGTKFGVGVVSASYAGTNYDMRVTYQGNDALLSQAGPRGTTILFR